ncbi:hypothetical protein HBI27_002710 [Parastagonospora nodorum]|nr:hypothetical protein HBI27_002710 [Parastagonospora nodorum]
MEFVTEITAQGRQNRTSTTPSTVPSAPPTYGYHNTYHTHAQLPAGSPPTYARANDPKTLRHLEEKAQTEVACSSALPPAYSCSVELSGVLGLKPELSSPFHVAGNREWFDAFVVLQGTRLSIYRVKMPGLLSKSRAPSPGKLIHSYSLQHAEVGVASDFKKTPLVPRSPFAHLVPASTRPKLYETDPHLFEPVREHAIRLRLETEQFLICAPSQESMLDWIESLCAAVDISTPIEDRSEPRYRSLPRRSRRQRLLDSAQLGENMENLTNLEAGRRIIAQQEQIIRQLYPHLAGSAPSTADSSFGTTTTITASTTPAPTATDVDMLDDFDPEDVTPPSRSSQSPDEDFSPPSSSPSDPKDTEPTRTSPSQILRYRRRCAPVLLASSPRVSDIVFMDNQRFRIDVKQHILVDYTPLPPRYDAHNFPKQKRLTKLQRASKIVVVAERPGSPVRGVSDDSIASISFGEDLDLSIGLGPSASADSVGGSGPPSPTQAKGKRIEGGEMEAGVAIVV